MCGMARGMLVSAECLPSTSPRFVFFSLLERSLDTLLRVGEAGVLDSFCIATWWFVVVFMLW